MIKNPIVFTADWHIRDFHLNRFDRGQDFTKSALAIVELAAKRNACAILNGGDILNVSKPSSKNIDDLMAINTALVTAGIPMYTISGNHDWAEPSWISLIAQAHGYNDRGIICIDNKTVTLDVHGLELNIHGIPYMPREAFLAARDSFPTDVDILMWHGAVKEFCGFPTDSMLTIPDFPKSDRLKAILMGDIHKFDIRTVDGIVIGYPGSTELCEKSESADKYVTLFDPINVNAPFEPVKLSTRPVSKFKILTEDDFDKDLVKALKAASKKNSIIYVDYDPVLVDLPSRVKVNIANDKCIVKFTPYTTNGINKVDGVANDEEDASLTVDDFIAKKLSDDTDLASLAESLSAMEDPAQQLKLMDAFIADELK